MFDEGFVSELDEESRKKHAYLSQMKVVSYEMNKTMVEMSAVKLELVSEIIKWMDELATKYPGAMDDFQEMTEKLLDREEIISSQMKESFDKMMELGGLYAEETCASL